MSEEELKIVRCAECTRPIKLGRLSDEIHYSRYLGKWFCDRECAAYYLYENHDFAVEFSDREAEDLDSLDVYFGSDGILRRV